MLNGTKKVNNQIMTRLMRLQQLKGLTTMLVEPDRLKFQEVQIKLLGIFIPLKNLLEFKMAYFLWDVDILEYHQ